jgi:hypothetical protein
MSRSNIGRHHAMRGVSRAGEAHSDIDRAEDTVSRPYRLAEL